MKPWNSLSLFLAWVIHLINSGSGCLLSLSWRNDIIFYMVIFISWIIPPKQGGTQQCYHQVPP